MSNLSLKDLVEVLCLLKSEDEKESNVTDKKVSTFFEVGKCYFVRTVTMHLVGRIIGINDQEIKFENASWIADSGRFHDALRDGDFSEVEPFVEDVIMSRGCIIDATVWNHPLPDKQK